MDKKSIPPTPPAPFTFDKSLLIPPRSQLELQNDAVAERVIEMDARAARLAAGFGIPYSQGIELEPMRRSAKELGEKASGGRPEQQQAALVALIVAGSSIMMAPSQKVTVERRDGRWGLYYHYTPAPLFGSSDRASCVPLKDAPIAIRRDFLQNSEEFFRGYLEICKGQLGNLAGVVEAADRTLALLDGLQVR